MKATLFKEVGYSLNKLIEDIDRGEIALPDIQRPFVWTSAKVRDLFDSMYLGFPVGYLLFWANGAAPGARQIGVGQRQAAARLLIVDGQQRLTSLFAVMKGLPVVGEDHAEHEIKIAFRPRDSTFSVADAAIRKDPEFLPDISQLWVGRRRQVEKDFLERLSAAREGLSSDEEEAMGEALDRLYDLHQYPFTALELAADLDEEQVAEVFVRINSKGVTLNQADFILTLMSVFWEEGRAELEAFSRLSRTPAKGGVASPFNYFIQPGPDQLLRVAIALGFRRGRLKNAYSVLRGRDVDTAQFSDESREKQFDRLRGAQSAVLNVSHWHDFMRCLLRAGYRSDRMVTSENALLYTYALYLIGLLDYGVDRSTLRDTIARWFFMSSLTGRYTSSPETSIESDLNLLREVETPDSFVSMLDGIVDDTLTGDFWEIGLPNALATSASRSPTLFAYLASLCILDAPVLFSKLRCSALLDPAIQGTRKAVERHHLFPRAHLEANGVSSIQQINQIANYTLVEWWENAQISHAAPGDYWPAYHDRMLDPSAHKARLFSPSEVVEMTRLHALPEDWHMMSYTEFLERRRWLMAGVIRDAFERLRGADAQVDETEEQPTASTVLALIQASESKHVEMKASMRTPLGTGEVPAKVIEKMVAKTVAGFLNAEGGTLLIGVHNDGRIEGLEPDFKSIGRGDRDGFEQAFVNLIRERLGADVAPFVRLDFVDLDGGKIVATVRSRPHGRPVYLRDGDQREFYVRTGSTTQQLNVEQAQGYITSHWG